MNVLRAPRATPWICLWKSELRFSKAYKDIKYINRNVQNNLPILELFHDFLEINNDIVVKLGKKK